ncbi:MAG: hypothetical protein H6876_06335 [Hyphomicrobiaceae bacterium]|nr:hypothetical protein [Hyphomicrobiaceae bacterium]
MIGLARLAVLLAAGTTLWFNGSYAYLKGDGLTQKMGLIALAVTIDLAKCTFLGAAALTWNDRYRLRAFVFALLWLPALAFSTFCGFSFITTNRTTSSALVAGKAEQRVRAQDDYDRSLADLDTAKQSPNWHATAACTAPKNRKQRDYCASVASLEEALSTASAKLGSAPTFKPDPELTTLRAVVPLDTATLTFIVSAVPAFLIELLASLGSYAVSPRFARKAPEMPAEDVSRLRAGWWRRRSECSSAARSVALETALPPTSPELAALAKSPRIKLPRVASKP